MKRSIVLTNAFVLWALLLGLPGCAAKQAKPYDPHASGQWRGDGARVGYPWAPPPPPPRQPTLVDTAIDSIGILVGGRPSPAR